MWSAWADGRFLKAQKEFLNVGVSSRYAERGTFFLEPKRSATQRATDSILLPGVRTRHNTVLEVTGSVLRDRRLLPQGCVKLVGSDLVRSRNV